MLYGTIKIERREGKERYTNTERHTERRRWGGEIVRQTDRQIARQTENILQ